MVPNTLVVTVVVVAGNLVFCSLAGYAFARIKFFGREVVFILVLATLMIPFQVIMIPTFLIVRSAGLIDTLGALIVPNLASAFGIFLMRQFFRIAADRARGGGPHRRRLAARRAGARSCCRCPRSGARDARRDHVHVDVERLPVAADHDLPRDNMTLQLGLTTFQGVHQTNTRC